MRDGTLTPDGGELLLPRAGSFVIFQVTTIHASTPNRTNKPRRLAIFAHCPRSLWEPQLHPGNQNAVVSEGAFETSYLRAVAEGKAQPRVKL